MIVSVNIIVTATGLENGFEKTAFFLKNLKTPKFSFCYFLVFFIQIISNFIF